jgi:hypothetical protein
VPQKLERRHNLLGAPAASATQVATAPHVDHPEHRPEASRPRIFDLMQGLAIGAMLTELRLHFKLHFDNPALDLFDYNFAVS